MRFSLKNKPPDKALEQFLIPNSGKVYDSPYIKQHEGVPERTRPHAILTLSYFTPDGCNSAPRW